MRDSPDVMGSRRRRRVKEGVGSALHFGWREELRRDWEGPLPAFPLSRFCAEAGIGLIIIQSSFKELLRCKGTAKWRNVQTFSRLLHTMAQKAAQKY